MKLLISIFIFTSALFAFENDKDYTCLNVHVMKQGTKHMIKKEEAEKNPFDFKISNNQLVSSRNVVFDFKMKKGDMSSYSNKDYMLLLMKNEELGLVPKQGRGQLQFYFQCKLK